MPMNEYGYIHILINPSFKEDWIKLIVTENPILSESDLRQNREIPLPYVVYATIQIKDEDITCLYSEFEARTAIDYITQVETFFNISPKQALEVFYDIAFANHLKMEISIYDNDLIHVLLFDRGIQNVLEVFDEEIEYEESDFESRYDYSGVWTDRELRDACDAAYEGHSRLELGLD